MRMKFAFLILLALSAPAFAEPLFTAAEAERGEGLYNSKCASCHGRNLVSRGDPPSLTGEPFELGWMGKTLGDRFAAIKETMPPKEAGDLPDQTVRDIIAYVLKFNGFEAGAKPLPEAEGDMAAIRIAK